MSTRKIIFLDDELDFLDQCRHYYDSRIKSNSNVVIEFFEDPGLLWAQIEKIRNADAVVSDLKLGNTSGLQFLELVRQQNPTAKLILITGQIIRGNEQLKCKELKIEFVFKFGEIENLLDKIVYFSQPKNANEKIKHVFISYRNTDYDKGVKRIVEALEKNNINVWIDKESIDPGYPWEITIRRAIEEGWFFLACFSNNYWNQTTNYMNEELQIAIDQLRKMPDDEIWFIPVKLDNCQIPYFEIRKNLSLHSKQYVALYEDWDKGITKIIKTIKSN